MSSFSLKSICLMIFLCSLMPAAHADAYTSVRKDYLNGYQYSSSRQILVLKMADGAVTSFSEVPPGVFRQFKQSDFNYDFYRGRILQVYPAVQGDLLRPAMQEIDPSDAYRQPTAPPPSLSTRGLLDTKQVYVYAGLTRPGDSDLNKFDDLTETFGLGVHWPIRPNLDIAMSLGRNLLSGNTTSEEVFEVIDTIPDDMGGDPVIVTNFVTVASDSKIERTTTTFTIDGVLYTEQDASVNAFVAAGLQYAGRETKVGSETDTDNNFGIHLGAGVEIALSPRSALLPAVYYSQTGTGPQNDSDLLIDLLLAGWFNDRLGYRLLGSFGANSGDLSILGGLSLGF